MKKRLAFLTGLVTLVLVTSNLWAQIDVVKMDDYKSNHPRAKFYGSQYFDDDGIREHVGTADLIYGTTLATGNTPFESAWNHANQLAGIYASEMGTLVPPTDENGNPAIIGAMYDKQTQTSKFSTFRFHQHFGGVPVFRSGIGFLIRNEANFPVVMSGSNLKELAGFELPGRIPDVAPKATRAMVDNVAAMMNARRIGKGCMSNCCDADAKQPQGELVPSRRPVKTSGEEIVVWAGVTNRVTAPQLALTFMAQRGSVETYPDYQKHLVVASLATGEVLHAENQITHYTDVDGTVSGRATFGLASLECDPELTFRLPYADVEILGGNSSTTNANGEFSIVNGGNNQVTVRSYLQGTYFNLFDQGNGGSTPFLDLAITPPGPVDFLHNPTNNNEFSTSNVNAYLQANNVRDYVLSYEPNFPTIANQTGFGINTNINSTCNATYDGSNINFYRAGGGCNNTSFADVIYHEYGHHLVNVTGNGQSQFGEGSGDSVGVLMEDDPVLGNGFQGNCAAGIRNADNNKQYPCSGGIHDCGQLISGCVWSLRNELAVTEPNSFRDIGSQLFFGMLIARGQLVPGNGTIEPNITIIYLELDDDDTDIGNGTPHYPEIAAAFGSHNMDAPPLDLLQFDYPTNRPDFIAPSGGVAFTVEVSSLAANPVPGTGVLFVDSGSGFQSFPMNEVSPNVYEANFPSTTCLSEIKYYFSADADNGGTQFDPSLAPGEFYTAISAIDVQIVYEDNLESDAGWSISGSVLDGAWDRGTPVGGGDRGDPANDADGSGACFLTDNVDGNSDVDDGTTTLTSNAIDTVPPSGKETLISYQRWYSNNFGNDPENDVFVVEISNDDGATWSNLETVGPSGAEVRGGWIKKTFRVADFVTPTSNVRLRFNASDLSDGSVVEAGIDQIQVMHVTCVNTGGPGESGLAPAMTHAWQTVNLNQTFTNPVVIMGTPTRNGGDPVTIRVRNVTSNSFEVRILEWDYLNGFHNAAEDVPYIVMEAGTHTLADGTVIEAGTSTISDGGWNSASLTASFSSTPVIFSQLMTENEANAVSLRHRNISASGFDVRMAEEEGADQVHADETLGWIAMEAASGTNGSYVYESGVTGNSVRHTNFSLNYTQSYGSNPLLFTTVQSNDGGDPCIVRGRNLSSTSGAVIYLEEEKSGDTETMHTTEVVGFWVMSSGAIE